MEDKSIEIGQRFGKLTVMEKAKGTWFLCRCDCGMERAFRATDLIRKHNTSCGATLCSKIKDFTGKRFGRLVVLGLSHLELGKKQSYPKWVCACDCGNIHIVGAQNLTGGTVTSCGCLRKQRLDEGREKHLMSRTSVYTTYQSIIQRCYNKNNPMYYLYGARGINVFEEWLGEEGFEKFYIYVGNKPTKEHSIDRIDNNGNYEPGNIRWATKREQARNTRNNSVIEFNGEKHCKTEWAEMIGISASSFRWRYKSDNYKLAFSDGKYTLNRI